MITVFPFILIFKADDANSHKSNGVPRLEVFIFFLFFFLSVLKLFPVMFFKQIRSLLFVLNVLSG